jgi:GNAT superfamily N-acetyltransferase
VSWREPPETAVRGALENWRGSTGLRMTNIVIGHQADARFGEHFWCRTDFELDGEWVGRFRVRYRANGTVLLEHVYLEKAAQADGLMTELLADFIPRYQAWGLDRVEMRAESAAGAAFAKSVGMSEEEDGWWAMTVPDAV